MRHSFALGMLLSIGLLACGGSTTGDGGGGGGGSNDPDGEGGSCPSLAAAQAALDIPPACASCMGASCCSELGACTGDGACMDIALCVSQCRSSGGTNDSCTPGCSTGSDAAGSTDLDALGVCVNAHCAAACDD